MEALASVVEAFSVIVVGVICFGIICLLAQIAEWIGSGKWPN